MSDKPLFSVVIGYRNWGGERLRLAVESHLQSTLGDKVEIIVSDFGSDNERRADKLLAGMPVRCVYTETDEPWSRSRALNAGVAEARGEYILAWDADILCAPTLHEELLAHFRAQPNSAYPLHCRDLDQHYDEAKIRELVERHGELPIDALRAHSQWRPRWGMGIAAYRRKHFDLIRGYDERMAVWGGEDRDLMNRFSRLGVAVRWVDSPAVDIFHIYHGSSLDEAASTTHGQAAVSLNHDLVQRDRTIFRNLRDARYLKTQCPLVSVVVATYNRGRYLAETIPSILDQSFRDFELIVVDDGSDDDTQAVLEGFDDQRLVVIRQENAGVAAARNNGIRNARGHYMLVHDDDDIMLPNRIETQLACLPANAGGSYGGWVDFNDETGEFVTVNSGKDFSAASIGYAGKVLLHPTVMTTRWIAEHVPYDERYKGGSDFNWMMTIASNGAELVHTGNIHILRRLHGGSLTSGGSGQKHASRASARSANASLSRNTLVAVREFGRATESRHCVQEDELDELYQHLPESLRRKEYHFEAIVDDAAANTILGAVRNATGVVITSVQPVHRGGVSVLGLHRLRGISDSEEQAQVVFENTTANRRGWWSSGPIAGRRSFAGVSTPLPPARILGSRTPLGNDVSPRAWSLLDEIADYHAIPAESVLIAVGRERVGTVRLGQADRLVRKLSREARRIAVMVTRDGVVPIYRLDDTEATSQALRRLSNAWGVRKFSLLVHQRSEEY